MTREEAIKILELETRQEALSPYLDRPLGAMLDAIIEASRLGASALRAQQKPAKLDRSRWVGCEMCRAERSTASCAEGGAHDFRVDGDGLFYFDERYGWEGIKIKYCPFCGRPLTEAAWAELERKIGGNDETVD